MNIYVRLVLICFILFSFILTPDSSIAADVVKKTTSRLCHSAVSPFYNSIIHFDSYSSIELCIGSGGREYKRTISRVGEDYEREHFGKWQDDDHNCLNTRHEILVRESKKKVTFGESPCTVETGEWFDPYTDLTFFKADEVDIDHLVPLKWAWLHGANGWTRDIRETFANDRRNLYVVDDSTNQSKGPKGPLKWLPPVQNFHCQYVSSFMVLVEIYNLDLSESERDNFQLLKNRKCLE